MKINNMNEQTIRFSISLPKELLDELDSRFINQGYSSRSEFVRDLIREKMVEDKWDENSDDVSGVLTIVYDHHQRELTQKLIDIQHDCDVNILCNTHIHIDHHNCLEVIMMKGNAIKIEKLSCEIGGLKGVKFSKLTKASGFK
ncbi:MAG: nickel-responsive transcriptional regulator NikR [Campylobacterales bacterium]|nr:nickel-responsive transcriptional regulator NikR [Campylobacterales bacterium]